MTLCEHAQLVEDCQRRRRLLNDWEREFIDSIAQRLASGKPLAPRQVTTLDEIWDKATAEG